VTTTPNPDPARAGSDQPPPARSAPPASARADDHRLLTADELVALARLDSDEPLTDTDLAALNRLDERHHGPDVDPREWELGDPETGAPPEWMALSGEERAWLDDRPEPAPVRPEILDAGFTHCGATGGIGFAGGGVLDKMPAGQELAACAERTWDAGLGKLADDELAGLICAARRNASRQAALELAAIGELAARRAGPDGAPGEHLEDEIAALLRLSGRAAAKQVALAAAMTRLPTVAQALAVGQIDVDKAGAFADELIVVDDDEAAAQIATSLIEAASGLTTGQIRARLRNRIDRHDPEAAKRRKEKARQDARVDVWIDADGTGAIAARGMDPAAAITADQHLDADARWLQDHGVPGTLDQLRVAAAAARLAHQPLYTLFPQHPASGNGTADTGAANSTGRIGGANSNAGTGAAADSDAAGAAADSAGADSAGADSAGAGAAGAGMADEGAGTGPTSDGPAVGADRPDRADGAANPHGSPADGAGWPAGPGGLGGSVNLTMPADTWLGGSDNPGQADRYGVLDAGTCRDLADALATAGARARWCITLVDPDGRAVAHGCARAGPGPPGSDRAAWLGSVTITSIEAGTCAHRRESAGYRPSSALRHIVKIRSPRCGFPGCRRRAERCDDDHTVPHHKGGKTCECNLYPLCRRHHRAKQAQGWHLAQPEPGVLVWTLPCGRTITTRPEPYPV
jgi:hypothetical protein